MKVKTDKAFTQKFATYPKDIQNIMQSLRNIVLSTAKEIDCVQEIHETLKWGEPSFVVSLPKNQGSTLRIDWKEKSPHQYAMYFKCTSQLVPTFKEVFGEKFHYEKNRALLFGVNESVPKNELKQCVRMALMYHKVKHLKFLGFDKNH